MPVGLPPRGGPLGRTRGRLSASALTTYLRCPQQWLLGYQVGLRGATRPSQILGIVLEDALCELLMMHPPEVSSFDDLRNWANNQLDAVSSKAMETGTQAWEEVLWKSAEDAWETVTVSSLNDRIAGGLEIFFEEVKACYSAGGGPFLEVRRTNTQPFSVPEPSLGSPPSFPLP